MQKKWTKIQQIILPRNWLFGRLSGMYGNLRNINNYYSRHFTENEIEKLQYAENLIYEVISEKKDESEKLKQKYSNGR